MIEFVLADTSVWIMHFRQGEGALAHLLEQGKVACHPFIVGELACGNLTNRQDIISSLNDLPKVDVLEHRETMEFIESRQLMGRGIGYVDIHLLGSALLSNASLWTRDKALAKAADHLGIGFIP